MAMGVELGTLQHAWHHMIDLSSLQIDALLEIVEAVEGKVEVFLDGGVRKGTDVLKALALGAKAVFVGRPIIWGLASQVIGGQWNKHIKQNNSEINAWIESDRLTPKICYLLLA